MSVYICILSSVDRNMIQCYRRQIATEINAIFSIQSTVDSHRINVIFSRQQHDSILSSVDSNINQCYRQQIVTLMLSIVDSHGINVIFSRQHSTLSSVDCNRIQYFFSRQRPNSILSSTDGNIFQRYYSTQKQNSTLTSVDSNSRIKCYSQQLNLVLFQVDSNIIISKTIYSGSTQKYSSMLSTVNSNIIQWYRQYIAKQFNVTYYFSAQKRRPTLSTINSNTNQ